MKDKGEIYILVGEFDEYSARTLQLILASFDKSQLDTLKSELEQKAEAIEYKYKELLGTAMAKDVFEHALKDLDQEARKEVSPKFNFRCGVEFTVETVEFLTVTKRRG